MPQVPTEERSNMLLNREGWLTEMSEHVRPFFKGFKLSTFRLTCGWPSKFALGRRSRRIGECHAMESSKGGVHEIFISPTLDKPLEVAGVMCHEIAHVAAGIGEGHKGKFVTVCKYVGITKNKPTQAMPGSLLEERLQKIIDKVGNYPHHALVPSMTMVPKKLSSITLECEECGCKVSMATKWIEEVGPPTCACGGFMGLGE